MSLALALNMKCPLDCALPEQQCPSNLPTYSKVIDATTKCPVVDNSITNQRGRTYKTKFYSLYITPAHDLGRHSHELIAGTVRLVLKQ